MSLLLAAHTHTHYTCLHATHSCTFRLLFCARKTCLLLSHSLTDSLLVFLSLSYLSFSACPSTDDHDITASSSSVDNISRHYHRRTPCAPGARSCTLIAPPRLQSPCLPSFVHVLALRRVVTRRVVWTDSAAGAHCHPEREAGRGSRIEDRSAA